MTASRCTAFILARGGSKRIIRKNMRELAGQPLLYWSIRYALLCPHIENTIVSSDDPEILQYCQAFDGVRTIERPKHLSGDFSNDLEGFGHCLETVASRSIPIYDFIVHLRATNPFRKLSWMDEIMEILKNKPEIDTVRSVEEASDTPFKMWFKSDSQLMKPVVNIPSVPFAHSMPKQALPKVYRQNAHLDVIKTSVVRDQKIVGDHIYGYETEDNLPDIDLPIDLTIAREHFGELIDKSLTDSS